MKKIVLVPLLALSFIIVAACGAPGTGIQVVSGVAALQTFPTPPTSVRAVSSGKVVAEAQLSADGSFSLNLPTGHKYSIEFAAGAVPPVLVMPRTSGQVDAMFFIRGSAAPFSLGTVRYIGDPGAAAYHYTARSTDASADGDADQNECEDGVDPNSGAVCVDDNDEQGAGECGGEEAAAESDTDTDQSECQDGIDPATGLECDGGPAANAQDGDQEKADSEAESPSEAALADHNLPASVGCPDQDNDNHECEDGIDPATGLECDGGPAANSQDGDGTEGDKG